MEAYQFKPPNLPVVLEVLSKVEMRHELKNESR